jgi:hypothetical protein
VVFTLDMHRTGLRAVLTHLLSEMNLSTLFQFVEIDTEYAIAMKVDLPPIRGLNHAIVLGREKLRDPSMWFGFMMLYITAALPDIILQLTTSGIEGISDCYIGILVGMVLIGMTIRDDLFARQGDIDFHAKKLALMMVLMRRIDNDAATGHVLGELFELGGLFSDFRLHGIGMLHVAKGYL